MISLFLKTRYPYFNRIHYANDIIDYGLLIFMKERKWNKIVSYAIKEPILLVPNISSNLIFQARKFYRPFRVCLKILTVRIWAFGSLVYQINSL